MSTKYSSHPLNFGATGWFVIDFVLAFMVMQLAYHLSPSFNPWNVDVLLIHMMPFNAGLIYAAAVAALAHIFGLHDPFLRRQFWPMVGRCVGTVLIATGVLATIVFAVLYQRIGRIILIEVVVITPGVMALARRAVWHLAAQRKRRVLLVGAGTIGTSLFEQIRRSELPLDVIAFVDLDQGMIGQRIQNRAVMGYQAPLEDTCRSLQIDEVVNCVGSKLSQETLNQLMNCQNLGVRVSGYSQFIERYFFQVPAEFIPSDWFLEADLELTHPIYLALKRFVDVCAAFCGLILSSPILLMAVIAIKLESRGPAFYSQIRTGLFNQPFRIYKLRSMRTDAEPDGPQWAERKDDRITRTGTVIRKSRIDEIPQFWNILRGEMTLVGPRPERPEFVEQLAIEIPHYKQRHLVKPGLTGWTQINYPYGSSVEDALNKLRYDLYYIKYASIALDIQIILRTIGAVMKGAR